MRYCISVSNVSSGNECKIWVPNSKSVVLKSRPCYLGMHTRIAFQGWCGKRAPIIYTVLHGVHSNKDSKLSFLNYTQLATQRWFQKIQKGVAWALASYIDTMYFTENSVKIIQAPKSPIVPHLSFCSLCQTSIAFHLTLTYL